MLIINYQFTLIQSEDFQLFEFQFWDNFQGKKQKIGIGKIKN